MTVALNGVYVIWRNMWTDVTKVSTGNMIGACVFCFVATFVNDAVAGDLVSWNMFPGETYIVDDGTYTADLNLVISGNCTLANPCLYKAETPGGVVISGDTEIDVTGDYITLEGFVFKDNVLYTDENRIYDRVAVQFFCDGCGMRFMTIDNYNYPANLQRKTWYVIIKGKDTIIEDNSFYRKRNAGQLLTSHYDLNLGPDRNIIRRNHFFDLISPGGEADPEVIVIGGNPNLDQESEALIEDNLFDHNDELGAEMVKIAADRVIIRNNTFRGNNAVALNLRRSDGSIVYGNKFWGDPGNANSTEIGVGVYGEDHLIVGNYFESLKTRGLDVWNGNIDTMESRTSNSYSQAKNSQVRFNTFWNNDYQAIRVGGGGGIYSPDSTFIKYNLVVDDSSGNTFTDNASTNLTATFNTVDAVDPDEFISTNNNEFDSVSTSKVWGVWGADVEPVTYGYGAFHDSYNVTWVTSDPWKQNQIAASLATRRPFDPWEVGSLPTGFSTNEPECRYSLTADSYRASKPRLVGNATVTHSYGGFHLYRNNEAGDSIEFAVNVKTAGDYTLWARTFAPGTSGDSFTVTAGDQIDVTWWIPIGNATSRFPSDSNPAVVHMTPGCQNIKFKYREPNAAIYYILLYKN